MSPAHRDRRRAAPVVAVCVTATLLAACSGGDDEVTGPSPSPTATVAAPSPSPSPSPSPPPPPPVEGELTVSTLLASRPERLGTGAPDAPDRDRATAAAREVATVLDSHLTALQGGGGGLAALGAAWVDTADGRASLTTALGSADNPVAEAAYHVAVQWDEAPTTAAASVRLTRADGSAVAIDLLFDVSGDAPALVLFGEGTSTGGDG